MIDAIRAIRDESSKIFQDCEDGYFFVDNIPSQYITLCRSIITDINDVLTPSGYEVLSTYPDWRFIRLKNVTNEKVIDLYSDGRYVSKETLSSELTDTLIKVHNI